MATRNPKAGTARPSVSTAGPSNTFDGLHTAPTENLTDIDLLAIPPNGKRPIEVTPTSHLFGDFSD